MLSHITTLLLMSVQMYARHADFLAACVGHGFEMVRQHLSLWQLPITKTYFQKKI